MRPTIIIADDHPATSKGMEMVLKKMQFVVLSSHTNGLQALNQIVVDKPDYVLLDVQMPGLSGIDIAERMKAKGIKSKVIIFSMFTDAALFERAKELQVHGYLLKEFALDDLETCVKAIQIGKHWYHPRLEERLQKSTVSFSPKLYHTLSSKERIILSSIADNKSTKHIAEEQFLSEKTIESHRRNIIKKLGLPSKKNTLLIWAIENKGFFSLMD